MAVEGAHGLFLRRALTSLLNNQAPYEITQPHIQRRTRKPEQLCVHRCHGSYAHVQQIKI